MAPRGGWWELDVLAPHDEERAYAASWHAFPGPAAAPPALPAWGGYGQRQRPPGPLPAAPRATSRAPERRPARGRAAAPAPAAAAAAAPSTPTPLPPTYSRPNLGRKISAFGRDGRPLSRTEVNKKDAERARLVAYAAAYRARPQLAEDAYNLALEALGPPLSRTVENRLRYVRQCIALKRETQVLFYRLAAARSEGAILEALDQVPQRLWGSRRAGRHGGRRRAA